MIKEPETSTAKATYAVSIRISDAFDLRKSSAMILDVFEIIDEVDLPDILRAIKFSNSPAKKINAKIRKILLKIFIMKLLRKKSA
ncbi:MAG: hypothetical protein PHW02_00950 [bacterium]|nr:hypothetical protein [bacterium]